MVGAHPTPGPAQELCSGDDQWRSGGHQSAGYLPRHRGQRLAAAEALFNPEMIVRPGDPTIGQFLAEVESRSDLKPRTFRLYRSVLRRIVADLFSLRGGSENSSNPTERTSHGK